MPQHAIPLRAEAFDRALRAEIEVVGAQADHFAPEFLERVRQEQEFAGGVDVAALRALRVPGIPDLPAIEGRDDVVVARGAEDRAGGETADGPRKHVAATLTLKASAM